MHLIIYKYRFEVLWDGSHLSIFWPNGGYQEVHSMDPAGTFDFWWFHDVASMIHCSQSCVEYVIDIYKPLPHEGLYRRAYPLDTSGRIWKVKWMWYFWIFWATKGYPLWINDEACALCQAFRPSHMRVTALSMITTGMRCQYHPTGSCSASVAWCESGNATNGESREWRHWLYSYT